MDFETGLGITRVLRLSFRNIACLVAISFLNFHIGDAGNTPLVGDGTPLGRDHSRCPRECQLGALAVLHPGVPVMWHTHIRDLSPTAEAVKGSRISKVTSCLGCSAPVLLYLFSFMT